MSELRPFARAFIGWIVILPVPLGVICLLVYVFLDLWSVCITEIRGKMSGLAGFDFEISETNCDFIGNEDWISVFVLRPGRPRQTLLFEYYPGGVDLLPVIEQIGQHSVQISVPWISEIRFRRDGLKGLSVVYNIGKIDYPHVDPKQK